MCSCRPAHERSVTGCAPAEALKEHHCIACLKSLWSNKSTRRVASVRQRMTTRIDQAPPAGVSSTHRRLDPHPNYRKARPGMSMPSSTTVTASPRRCAKCKEPKPPAAFAIDRSRADGLTYWCRDCRNVRAREAYQPAPRPNLGRRRVGPREGDRLQARRRVNYLIDIGSLPKPCDVPCVDCGHEWRKGERRHEYDHHLGYGTEHHEDVQAVCTTCHHRRERERRAA